MNNWSSTTVRTFAVSGNNIFAGSFKGVFLSSDTANSWVEINNGLLFYSNGVNCLIIRGSQIYAGTSAGIFLSTNNGNRWTKKGVQSGVVSIAINGNYLFVGNYNGVLLSTDNGELWMQKNDGLTNDDVYCFAISKNIIFAGTGDGVISSTNNGDNWKHMIEGLPVHIVIRSFAIIENNIFLSSNKGVFISKDNGNSWIQKNNGLKFGISGVYTLAVCGNYIFAGTQDNGVFRAKLSDFGITNVEKNSIINKLELALSPNPASDKISISFLNSELSNKRIAIFNSLGIELRRFEEYELLGKNSLEFNIGNFPIGMYYCTLYFGTDILTKSFVVLR